MEKVRSGLRLKYYRRRANSDLKMGRLQPKWLPATTVRLGSDSDRIAVMMAIRSTARCLAAQLAAFARPLLGEQWIAADDEPFARIWANSY